MACLANCHCDIEACISSKMTTLTYPRHRVALSLHVAAHHASQARFSRCVAGLFVISHGVRPLCSFSSFLVACFCVAIHVHRDIDVVLQPSGCVLCVSEDGSMRWIDVRVE
jgi:hypothetical protein